MKKILFLILFLVPTFAFAETITVEVEGMTCDSCAQSIEAEVSKLPEVREAQASFEKKTLVLELKEGQKIEDEKLKELLEKIGYKALKITKTN